MLAPASVSEKRECLQPPLFLAVVLTRLLLSDEAFVEAEGAEEAWRLVGDAAGRGASGDIILATQTATQAKAASLSLSRRGGGGGGGGG